MMRKELSLKKETVKDLIDLAMTLSEHDTDNCELFLHFKAGIVKITMNFETMEAEL